MKGFLERKGVTKMKRREVLGVLAGCLFGMLAMFSSVDTAQAGQGGAANKAALYAKCAKACNDCKASCEACTRHCEAMIKAGVKNHEGTKQLSADCAEI